MAQASLEQIVQRMIDAGEPEENIATVIRDYNTVTQEPAAVTTPQQSFRPDNIDSAKQPKVPNLEAGKYDPPKERGLYEHIFEAPEFVTDAASRFAESVTEPVLDESPWMARVKGFLGGATEGAAGLLSPANIATMGRGRIPQIASQILGAGQTAHGISDLASGDTGGLADIAFGILGVSTPKVTSPELTPKPIPRRPELSEINPKVASAIVEPPKPRSTEDKIYDIARDKFNMGRDNPELIERELNPFAKIVEDSKNKPTATFLGLQEDGTPLWNIKGGPRDKSTVTTKTLQDLGIEVPAVPPDASRVRGDDLRKMFQQQRSAAMDAKAPGFKGIIAKDAINEATAADIASFKPQDADNVIKLGKNNTIGKFANEQQKKSLWSEVRDTNRALLTSFDFSAPGRQGKPLLLTKAYWTSFDDMFKSWGSQRAYDNVMESIQSLPSFKKQKYQTVNKNGKTVIREASLAERAGLDVGGKEETFRSNIAEKLIPGVKRSERAYSAFLNKLRADHFQTMIDDARNMGMDIDKNDVILKQIGNFINDATGRGSLGSLERAAPLLNETFFAPRLMASRINMYRRWLNPKTYSSENPVVRKQALKSLIATAGFGLAVGELARLAGAQVSNDPTSSDFRKIKVSENTRIDPFSGFQQYAVGASRLLAGETTSSNTGKKYDLTSGRFGMPSRASVASQFMQNKLAPIPSLVWSWMEGKDWNGQPFELKQALLDRTVPIVMQDLAELAQEDPKLLPLGVLPMIGEGLQTYGR